MAEKSTSATVPSAFMYFELVSDIIKVEPIAIGHAIRVLNHLRKRYGGHQWRKLKGQASVRLADGRTRRAEVHWYEAHGIGRVHVKIKRFLD